MLRARVKKSPPKKPHERGVVSSFYVADSMLCESDPTHVLEPAAPAQAIRAMLAAVLSEAIDDARRGDNEAIGWLADDAEVGTHHRFTVAQVLDALGIDREAFRQRLCSICKFADGTAAPDEPGDAIAA